MILYPDAPWMWWQRWNNESKPSPWMIYDHNILLHLWSRWNRARQLVQHNLIMTWFDIKFRRKKRIHGRRSQNFIFGQERADNLFEVGAIAAFCANRSILLHLILLKKRDNCHKKTLQYFHKCFSRKNIFLFSLKSMGNGDWSNS